MRDAPHKIPPEIAGSLNLLAHPAAGAAAFSALSLGLASQMLGMWMGAVAGATEASRRILETLDDQSRAPADDARPAAPVARVVRPSATVTVLADARAAAEKADRKRPVKRGRAAQPVAKAVTEVSAEASVPAAAPAAGPTAPAKPAPMEKPATPDDLKAIGGVGPKLETVLNGLGIWTYGQIAAWQPAEVAWVDDYLSFKGRINRDGWVAQAAALAAGRRGV